MTVHYRTKAFVFKKEDRGEADRVFSAFTYDYGRVEIRARAIRKIASKLRGGICNFALSEIEFIQGKNHKTLTDALFLEKYSNISQSLQKVAIANKIAIVIDSFIKGQEKDNRIYKLIQEVFNSLNSYTKSAWNCSLAYYYFFWNFLYISGYAPETSRCACCRRELNPEDLYFSFEEGGAVCRACSKTTDRKICAGTIKIIRLILEKDWKTLSKLKISASLLLELKEVSDQYYLVKKA